MPEEDGASPSEGVNAYSVSKTYEVEGNELKKAPSCPKCGEGYRLAVHEDRKTCGHCGYTEFSVDEE